MKKLIYILSVCIGLPIGLYSQSAFTEEKTLWTCSDDNSIKVIYRYNNYSNFFEIHTPFYIPASVEITGILRISCGSFEKEQLTAQQEVDKIYHKNAHQKQDVRSKVITLKGYASETIFYYNTKEKPVLTFEDAYCLGVFSSSATSVSSTPEKKNDSMTDEQVRQTFDLFFGKGTSKDLTIHESDVKQAKLLLKELIEKSCQLTVVDHLKDLEVDLKGVIDFVGASIKDCNKIKKGSYYETVRSAIAYNFEQAFKTRKETGEWL